MNGTQRKKKKKMNAEQIKYNNEVKVSAPKPHYLKNAVLAFVSGGVVCVIGQCFIDLYRLTLHLSAKDAGNPAVTTMIFIGALLTGLGVFDKLARYAGAGLAVPVTGFANSMVSSALEFKKEGLVTGIGSKMFMLAGSVITFGVVTAFLVGLIYALFVL